MESTREDAGDRESGHAASGLPAGVRTVPLVRRPDARGALVELCRDEWLWDMQHVAQWNHVVSRPNVLRGLHVHHTHWDYLYMAQGTMELALVEARHDARDLGRARVLVLDACEPTGVIIPPGVAHGFYFPGDAVLIYGVSHYWNPGDELGCRFDDPELDIPWSARDPVLSDRDRHAGSFARMVRDLEAAFSSSRRKHP